MLLSRHRLIFIHIQKTGGNSLSHLLLPLSDDQMTVDRHQDGQNRFGIAGPVTTRKHMNLDEYHAALGAEAFKGYRIVACGRDPLDRAISWYCSPYRWFEEVEGIWRLRPVDCRFERFAADLGQMRSFKSYLTVDGDYVRPDCLLRYESLQHDVGALAERFHLPLESGSLGRVNSSAASQPARDRLRADQRVRDLVRAFFEEDYRLLA